MNTSLRRLDVQAEELSPRLVDEPRRFETLEVLPRDGIVDVGRGALLAVVVDDRVLAVPTAAVGGGRVLSTSSNVGQRSHSEDDGAEEDQTIM